MKILRERPRTPRLPRSLNLEVGTTILRRIYVCCRFILSLHYLWCTLPYHYIRSTSELFGASSNKSSELDWSKGIRGRGRPRPSVAPGRVRGRSAEVPVTFSARPRARVVSTAWALLVSASPPAPPATTSAAPRAPCYTIWSANDFGYFLPILKFLLHVSRSPGWEAIHFIQGSNSTNL